MATTVHTIDVYSWNPSTDIVANSIPPGTPGRDGAFYMDSEQVSVLGNGFTLEGRPSLTWDSVGLFDISADLVTVRIKNGPVYEKTVILAHTNPISPDYPNTTRSVFTDMPSVDPVTHPLATVEVVLSAPGRTAHLGFFVVGTKTDLFACMLYNSQIGIVDYSRKERDVFGNLTLIERGYSNTIRYELGYDAYRLDQIRDYLASRRALLTVYIGVETEPETLILGYYTDFDIPLEPGPVSEGDLTVESLVYDKPATWSEYEIIFGDYDAATCDYDAALKTVTLIGGLPAETVQAAIKDRAIAVTETVQWYVTILDGRTPDAWSHSQIVTPCGNLAVWQWPAGTPTQQTGVQLRINAELTADDGTKYWAKSAFLTVTADPCAGQGGECLPQIVAPEWTTGAGQTETGGVVSTVPATVMKEIPAYTQIPIDNTGTGHKFFWIDLPQSLSTVTIDTVFATGTPTEVHAKFWDFCDPALPDENSPYSGENIFMSVGWADRNKWRAVLVRVEDGNYTGTIEMEITLQVPA